MIEDLVKLNRSCRRFHQEKAIDPTVLTNLVDLARISPSGMNLQPLKYITVADPQIAAAVFPSLAWAGYLKEWPGPEEGERPAGYIVILGDTRLSKNFGSDPGIAAQTMLLAAVEKGLAGCMIGSVSRENLRNTLGIPADLDIVLVLALGYPKEERVVVPVGDSGDIRYYRDENQVHYVPKRDLKDVLIKSV